jgi:basic membrane protein A and related proteins
VRFPRLRSSALILVALLAVFATACGSSSSSGGTSNGGGGSSTPAKPGANFKIGLVTDIGGLNDKSFNHLAYVGLQRAGRILGVQTKVETSNSGSDYVPNMEALATQHYNLVIGVGFLMDSAVKQVAKAFPTTKFAIVDDAPTPPSSNLQGLLFKEQESGYLAGYLAGLMTKTHVVSTVGGQKIPPVDHYIAGFQAGAKAADPMVKTLNDYSNSFTDNAKCKSLALNQISQHSDVVFQVAGGCGLGALSAAQEKHVWGIGVDADQAYLGNYILTSAIKKVDVAVYDTIKSVVDGSFQGGGVTTFDLTKGATGLGSINSAVPAADVTKLKAIQAKIKAGTIVPPDTVK